MSIWMTIKKNLPVTSDAAEYEAQRLLRSIGQLDAAIAPMAGAVSARQDELEARLGRLEQRCAADGADLRSRSQELEQELGAVRETLERSEQRLAARLRKSCKAASRTSPRRWKLCCKDSRPPGRRSAGAISIRSPGAGPTASSTKS